ncbi:hypothetical protein LSH36_23g10032 [Paralvinella palmiformis]|uniref:Carbohydrate sulfotransferase n=1 Tax=Paralvinella palmiformis TaxID=53620 RepID=A0AAD9NF94_9ANNE|nr:hypothetical protein LSH36_23g10032 [Paralvinella palmiformis]
MIRTSGWNVHFFIDKIILSVPSDDSLLCPALTNGHADKPTGLPGSVYNERRPGRHRRDGGILDRLLRTMRRKLRKALWYLICCTFLGNIFLFILHLSVNEAAMYDEDVVKSRAEKDWDREQATRKELIRKTCREIRESDDRNPWRRVARSITDSLLVDDIDEIMFCPTTHHRSSAWTSALHALVKTYARQPRGRHSSQSDREDRIIDRAGEETIEISNQRELNRFLQKYVKILFVVHPFDRLLAVFQDRFTNLIENRRSQYWNKIRRKILRLNHPSASEEEISSRQVTFDEYIHYLVFKQEHNVHWSVTYELCHPCDIEYDYVVKFDTIHSDIKYIMKSLYGTAESLGSVIGSPNAAKRNDLDTMRTYFRQPSLNSLLYLYDIYSLDFYMYNYTWPFATLTL